MYGMAHWQTPMQVLKTPEAAIIHDSECHYNQMLRRHCSAEEYLLSFIRWTPIVRAIKFRTVLQVPEAETPTKCFELPIGSVVNGFISLNLALSQLYLRRSVASAVTDLFLAHYATKQANSFESRHNISRGCTCSTCKPMQAIVPIDSSRLGEEHWSGIPEITCMQDTYIMHVNLERHFSIWKKGFT